MSRALYEQAREALRKVLKHHECYHNVELHDCEICTAKEALAAMEAAYE